MIDSALSLYYSLSVKSNLIHSLKRSPSMGLVCMCARYPALKASLKPLKFSKTIKKIHIYPSNIYIWITFIFRKVHFLLEKCYTCLKKTKWRGNVQQCVYYYAKCLHPFTHTCKAWTKSCTRINSQIAILTLTEASASGKIKDRSGHGSKFHHRRMSSYAVSRQQTAWHRWAFLLTEIWAKLYNPLHPKFGPSFVGYKTAESCSVWTCHLSAATLMFFVIICRGGMAVPAHNVIHFSLILCPWTKF